MRALLIIRSVVSVVFSVFTALAAADDSKPVVTIGLIDTFSPEFYIYTYSPTLDHLIKSLPEFQFNIVEIDPERIESDIKKYKPAFLVSSSSTYVSLMESEGAHQVATREPKSSQDVAHTAASAFIVPAESPILSLEESKGKTIAVSSKNSFDGWLIAKGEIAKLGDPNKFFKDVVETHHAFPDVTALLKSGFAEVGVLAACELERLRRSGAVQEGEFRVLNENQSHLGCSISTDLYPDAVFSSLPGVPSWISRKVAVSVLTMPSDKNDFQWTVANDFVPTYRLLKTLELGPFKPVSVWSFEAFVSHYKYQIVFSVFLLLLLSFHRVYVNALVRKRTAQLKNALVEREKFHTEARQNKERLDSMERLSVVSLLSSMVAHEIKQPITNISYYAGGLLMFLKKKGLEESTGSEFIKAIQSEVRRSTDIIDHVRGYAKERPKEFAACDLQSVVSGAIKYQQNPFLINKVKHSCWVFADKFDLEFIVSNFVKNALSAVAGTRRPKVEIYVEDEGTRWKLSVSDNGPELTDEQLGRLGKIGHSTKADGLGLGLSIASAMAESNGGHLEFAKRPNGGLIASLVLSKFEEHQ